MTYRIVMHYRRSARQPVLARGILSPELAELFVKALEADDREQHHNDRTFNVTYTIEEES